MTRLTVCDVLLLREALKMAAMRHESQAKWVEAKRIIPTPAERDHRVKAERMMALRAKLNIHTAKELVVA
jgi:hypothetical protein